MSMKTPLPLLVFTDLDGTLISHDTYEWDAAAPALASLRDIGAGVVLASSKTAAEIITLRQALGLERWPAIVENGAGLLAPHSTVLPDNAAYLLVRQLLNDTPPKGRDQYRGFGDMTAAEIAEITGLDPDAAARAAQRAFSEPGLWSGEPSELDEFLSELAQKGIMAREGGRFLTLSLGKTKADQMADIIAQYQPFQTVALGDAPNDVEMLETADLGIIIANPHNAPLPVLKGEATGRITRTTRTGPEGWNAAMLDLLARLNLT